MMKTETKPGEDRISELSDDVLCHILSFLPTKESVVTSSLSKRWRFLWIMVPSLDLECSIYFKKSHSWVNTFLEKTNKIKSFHLKCNGFHCCSRHVEQWITACMKRKIKELNISLYMRHYTTDIITFPALFTCTTLVTLKLKGRFDLQVPSYVNLPNVKSIHLQINVSVPSSSVISLISGSPALELFNLKQIMQEEIEIARNSREIRVFQHKWNVEHIYDLVIQSDRDYDFLSDFLDKDRRPNIVKAKVFMTVHDCYDTKNQVNKVVCDVLQGLRNVEFLSLDDFRTVMKSPSSLDLPLFKNLVKLRLFVKKVDSFFIKLLPVMCPELEVYEVDIMDDLLGINRRCRHHFRGGERESESLIGHFLT